jgi:protein-tyrosine phosphatase
MKIVEVLPGLFMGTKLVPPAEYESLGVDAIVDLEDWDVAWVPPVPTGSIYLSFPIEDDDHVEPKIREVAAFVASLVRSDRRVLVHCTEGINRSGVVVARALLELGWTAADAIELVRTKRGPSDDVVQALSNGHFVEWLLAEDAGEAP